MFPMLQTRVDSGWFLEFNTREWVDPTGEAQGPQGSRNRSTQIVTEDKDAERG